MREPRCANSGADRKPPGSGGSRRHFSMAITPGVKAMEYAMFDNTILLQDCPNCQRRINLTGRDLRRRPPKRCPGCNSTFDGRELDRELAKIEATFKKIPKQMNVKLRF